MNKVERVRAALQGGVVDHPPVTVWYHFGLQHAPAEKMASAHLDFLEAYDLDWLKVMNDYSYPLPKGLDVIATAADLRRIEPLDPATQPMGEQLRVIEILHKALGGRCLFVDTLLYRQAADLSYRTDLGRDVEAEAKDLELMIRQRGL